MKAIAPGLLLVALLAACAVSKDGAGVASKPEVLQGGVLIVGTTGPLRTLDEAARAEFYRDYLAAAVPGDDGAPGAAASAPVITAAQFQQRIAGWTTLRTVGLPLVVNVRYRVLVPADIAADTATPFVFGGSGDLVAARSDRDGLLWMDRVLCRAGRSYGACAEKYAAGVFSGNTGRELGRDARPKPDGEWVDVSSYVRLSKDPEHHSASELDVRAINRCDDCRGSLPGSVQSSVPVPPP